MASSDDLTRRVERAIKATENKGHHLISGDWLSYNPDNGTFCGCALGLLLLHEKGENVAHLVARAVYDQPSYQFFAEQLNLTSLEVEAFVAGFDDSGSDHSLRSGASEHECEFYLAGQSFRSWLNR